MPPQTHVKHLLWDGVAPADRTLLGATVVRVFGAEFADVRPVEALDGRKRTDGADGAARERPVRGRDGKARRHRLYLVYRGQRQRGSLVIRN